jgi:hypothetical protein
MVQHPSRSSSGRSQILVSGNGHGGAGNGVSIFHVCHGNLISVITLHLMGVIQPSAAILLIFILQLINSIIF